MPLVEALRMAFTTLWTQKLKSFFSLIGVLIGVTFLIAVVSIVQGMNVYMEEQFANRLIGLNTFQLRRNPGMNMGNISEETWREWMRRPRINYGDAAWVEAKLTTPVRIARSCDDRAQVIANAKSARDIEIVAADPDYFLIKNYDFSSGRPFTEQETRAGVPVAVLGFEVADKMFPGIDPVGKKVAVGGIPYRVIGVTAKQGTLFGISLDKFVIAPFTSPMQRLACRLGYIEEVHVQARSVTAMAEAAGQTEELMRVRRQLRPNQGSNFSIQTAEGALSGWKKISAVLFAAGLRATGVDAVAGVAGEAGLVTDERFGAAH